MTSRNSPLKKAVLLAAGKGTRMKELTADQPKPMIPVAGAPVLERILTGLVSADICHFLIITGYKGETIRAHFGDGSRWGISITYAHQVVQDGTGRVLLLARDFVGEDPFLLSYGDILVSPATYTALRDQWRREPTEGILTVQLGEDIRNGGLVVFDQEFNLRELVEKPDEAAIRKLRRQWGDFKPWYNAGIYVFTPRVFDYASRLQKSARGEYELTDAIRQMARDGLKLHVRKIAGDWLDIRDPKVLAEANRRLSGKIK